MHDDAERNMRQLMFNLVFNTQSLPGSYCGNIENLNASEQYVFKL